MRGYRPLLFTGGLLWFALLMGEAWQSRSALKTHARALSPLAQRKTLISKVDADQ
jgi:hypothetical protein